MKTGINFARCNCGNAREINGRDPKYLRALEHSEKKIYDIFPDRTPKNLHWTAPAYAGQSLQQILQACRMRYIANTGQNPQEEDRVRTITDKKTGLKKTVTTAGWSPIREGVCPVKEDTEIKDFGLFVQHLATKGLHVISIDIHRDQGYQNEVTEEREYNYHAHIIVDWTDHITGRTVKLGKVDMSEIQTVLADALHMERGVSKIASGKDHLTPVQYREKKIRERIAQMEAKAADLEARVKQAEKDLALNREDIRLIVNIAGKLTEDYEAGIIELFPKNEQTFHEEVLRRFNEAKKQNI